VPLLGQLPSFSIGFIINLSPLHDLSSKGIGFVLRHFAVSPEKENIFEGVKRT
jgi:hypothetical protein